MPCCLLGKFDPRSEAELGVYVGEVGLDGTGRNEKSCGDVLIGQTLAHQAHHVTLGRGQRCPAGRGSFAFTAAAQRVGNRLVGRHGRTLSPGGVKVRIFHGITKHVTDVS